MENSPATLSMTPIDDFVMTITQDWENEFTTDLTGLGSEQREYTSTASYSIQMPDPLETSFPDLEKYVADYLLSCSVTAELLDCMIFQTSVTNSLTDGSTGCSRKEAEHCVSSVQETRQDGQAKD